MNIQYEPYARCMDEVMALAAEHWVEVEWEAERMPLRVNQGVYLKADEVGILRTIVARDDAGSVCGYTMWFILENPKSVGTIIAQCEALYVDPEYRGHMLGPRLMSAAEAILKPLGVKAMGICVKNKADFGPMLKRVDFEPVETAWFKWIGDSELVGAA